ncbi:MAG: C39 family peptidase [Patescibacteria group bacterium]|nr:C39 family peptidase [Patescibacteria group bacterium]
MMQKMKLNVPYYSQHEDIKDEDWQGKACGLVCLKMVLDFHKTKTPEINEFLKLALEKEAFGESGWIHNKLLAIAEDLGMEAHRKEGMENEQELKDFLDEKGPVIVSIKAQKFSPEFEGKFHQIVLIDYDENGFYYHDSDYRDREGNRLFVPFDKFREYWRKMAIFIHKRGKIE